MIDTHVHTAFSADSDAEPRAVIEEAIRLGITHLAITDHQENEFHPSKWSLDFEDYFDRLNTLKAEYRDRITIAVGVEIGFAPPYNGLALEETTRYPFDTVINSVHNIDGTDLYYETFYQDKTKAQAYEMYLRTVEESVRAPYKYTQLGHLGYMARYARYPDRTLRYCEHAETIDRILRGLIDRDAVLELNASTDMGDCTTPTEIIARYYALGGRRIAPASDAHTLQKLGRRYKELSALARDIGFTEWTFCLGGKKLGFPI